MGKYFGRAACAPQDDRLFLRAVFEPEPGMVGDTHLYDNIWVHRRHTAASEWLGASGVIRFDQIFDFGNGKKGAEKATKELSDHRPTWALFATDVDDDDVTLAGLPLFRKAVLPSVNLV